MGVRAQVHVFFGAYGAPVVIFGGEFLEVSLCFVRNQMRRGGSVIYDVRTLLLFYERAHIIMIRICI